MLLREVNAECRLYVVILQLPPLDCKGKVDSKGSKYKNGLHYVILHLIPLNYLHIDFSKSHLL